VNTYAAASTEFQPLTVTVDGVASTDYLVAIVPYGTASTAITEWVASTTLGDETGVLVSGLEPGRWAVWTKVVDNPETVVQQVGSINIVP
jgi:hypothetical protein